MRSSPTAPNPVPELSDDQAAEELIAELSKTSNLDEEALYGVPGIRTMRQLIDHINRRTPQGMDHIALYKRTKPALDAKMAEVRAHPIRTAIRRRLRKWGLM